MRHLRERAAMAFFLAVVPLGFTFAVARPGLSRMDLKRRRLEEISQEMKVPPHFVPLRAGERTVLEDPAAPWRRRLPVVMGEQARLAHYDRVVSHLQGAWSRGGTPTQGIRSSWDPIRASFSLAGGLGAGQAEASPAADGPALQVHGWVLEARLGGGSDQLLKALAAVPAVEPLLEPVGLRWESTPALRQQSLWLRNLVVH